MCLSICRCFAAVLYFVAFVVNIVVFLLSISIDQTVIPLPRSEWTSMDSLVCPTYKSVPENKVFNPSTDCFSACPTRFSPEKAMEFIACHQEEAAQINTWLFWLPIGIFVLYFLDVLAFCFCERPKREKGDGCCV